MPQKIKIVLIGLGIILFISLISNMQTLRSQKNAEQERDTAKKENAALNQQISEISQQNRSLEKKTKDLNDGIRNITSEKDKVQEKYSLISKERDELLQKLEELKSKQSVASASEEIRRPSMPVSAAEETYWAGILKAKTDLEVQLSNLRNDLRNTQINNEQVQRDKVNLELEIRNLNRQTQELKQQTDYYQKVSDNLAQDLVREKSNKIQVENSARIIKSENIVLRKQLKALSERKIDLERKVVELQTKGNNLEESLTHMETMLKDKLFQIDDIRQQIDTGLPSEQAVSQERRIPFEESKESAVELAPIVVRPQQEAFAPIVSSQSGEVLLVNKENNFVIVSLGETSGIKAGDILNVYRGDREIAAVEAIQIRRNFSACDIKREDMPIKTGDRIR